MNKIRATILCLLILAACKKDGRGTMSGIEIRIENSTDVEIDSVMMVYDITYYNYGKISAGKTTPSHSYESMVDNPASTFVLNGNKILAGHIFIDPPFPQLASGRYILKISADTTLSSVYNAEFLKQ